MKDYVFLTFSLNSSSLSQMFVKLSNALSRNFNVLIITDINKDVSKLSEQIKVLKWPSTRPTKLKDFLFLSKLVGAHKPITMISMFSGDNLFLLVGYLYGVKNRISWARSLESQRINSNKYFRLRKRIIYRLATKVFANSEATRNDLKFVFKINESKLKRFYNLIEEIEFDAIREPYTLTFAGRLHATKGIDTLISAIKIVKEQLPEIQLRIIGGNLNGEAIKPYEKMVRNYDLGNNISFMGNQSKNTVLEYFSRSQLSIVPSLFEAFGFVVIESFSVKTPVIGSNTGGIKEIIRDGIDGYLVEPGNHEMLANRIVELLTNQEKLDQFKLNCYQRFKDEFELNTGVAKIAKYLVSLDQNV